MKLILVLHLILLKNCESAKPSSHEIGIFTKSEDGSFQKVCNGIILGEKEVITDEIALDHFRTDSEYYQKLFFHDVHENKEIHFEKATETITIGGKTYVKIISLSEFSREYAIIKIWNEEWNMDGNIEEKTEAITSLGINYSIHFISSEPDLFLLNIGSGDYPGMPLMKSEKLIGIHHSRQGADKVKFAKMTEQTSKKYSKPVTV